VHELNLRSCVFFDAIEGFSLDLKSPEIKRTLQNLVQGCEISPKNEPFSGSLLR
jgi:hypothetical protein